MRLRLHEQPNRGKIEVTSKPYLVTASAIKTIALRVAKKTKVADIVSVTVTKRRQFYQFDTTGEGCRHWVDTVVRDLETAGRLKAGAGSLVHNQLLLYYRKRTINAMLLYNFLLTTLPFLLPCPPHLAVCTYVPRYIVFTVASHLKQSTSGPRMS